MGNDENQHTNTEAQDLIVDNKEKTSKRSHWKSFKSFCATFSDWIGAIVARLLFLVVSLVCIGIAVSSLKSSSAVGYLLFVPIIITLVEAYATLKVRRNVEWKWGTLCIFAFLLCIVPSIWLLEIEKWHKRVAEREHNFTTPQAECRLPGKDDFSKKNLTVQDVKDTANRLCECIDCVAYMEQVLLFTLIIGRWLLPKAKDISSYLVSAASCYHLISLGNLLDQKAQLLLVNIAISADILELFELMKEEIVMYNGKLIVAVLIVWSFSLLQFGIVSTATTKKAWKGLKCFESEMWSLILLLCLDDFSFLLLRTICMFGYKVRSYNSYFFAGKNLLVLILDVNRIIALHKENQRASPWSNMQNSSRRLTHIRR